MLLTGQGNPPSSLAAARPLSSHATAQGGSREEQGTPVAALRGACVESDSCNRESLTEHSKATPRAGRVYLHRQEPSTMGHCLPLPGAAAQHSLVLAGLLPHMPEEQQVNEHLPQCWGGHLG